MKIDAANVTAPRTFTLPNSNIDMLTGNTGQILTKGAAQTDFQDPALFSISTNTTITVGSGKDYTTLALAFAYLKNVYIKSGAIVTLQLFDEVYALGTTPLLIDHPQANKIKINGVNYLDNLKTLISIESVSGSAGDWSYVLNLNNVTGITTDHFFMSSWQDYTLSGGTAREYLYGGFPITNVDAGNNRITVLSPNKYSVTASGAVTGTVIILKTVITTNGVDAIRLAEGTSVNSITNIVFKNIGTVGSSAGINATTGAGSGQGAEVQAALHAEVIGFYNFYNGINWRLTGGGANLWDVFFSKISNNGLYVTNGARVRGSSIMAVGCGTGISVAGMGFLLFDRILLSGNTTGMIVTENSLAYFRPYCRVAGNTGTGIAVSSNSTLFNSGTGSVITQNGNWGISNTGSLIDVSSTTITYNLYSGVYTNAGGRTIAVNAIVSNNGQDGFLVLNFGSLYAYGSIVSNNTSYGYDTDNSSFVDSNTSSGSGNGVGFCNRSIDAGGIQKNHTYPTGGTLSGNYYGNVFSAGPIYLNGTTIINGNLTIEGSDLTLVANLTVRGDLFVTGAIYLAGYALDVSGDVIVLAGPFTSYANPAASNVLIYGNLYVGTSGITFAQYNSSGHPTLTVKGNLYTRGNILLSGYLVGQGSVDLIVGGDLIAQTTGIQINTNGQVTSDRAGNVTVNGIMANFDTIYLQGYGDGTDGGDLIVGQMIGTPNIYLNSYTSTNPSFPYSGRGGDLTCYGDFNALDVDMYSGDVSINDATVRRGGNVIIFGNCSCNYIKNSAGEFTGSETNVIGGAGGSILCYGTLECDHLDSHGGKGNGGSTNAGNGGSWDIRGDLFLNDIGADSLTTGGALSSGGIGYGGGHGGDIVVGGTFVNHNANLNLDGGDTDSDTGARAGDLTINDIATFLGNLSAIGGGATGDVKASLLTQGLTFTAKIAGTIGNGYSVTVIDTSSGGLSYIEPSGAIVIDLGGDTPTTADVVTLLAGSAYTDIVETTPGSVIVASIESFTGGLDDTGTKGRSGRATFNMGGKLKVIDIQEGVDGAPSADEAGIYWFDKLAIKQLITNDTSAYVIKPRSVDASMTFWCGDLIGKKTLLQGAALNVDSAPISNNKWYSFNADPLYTWSLILMGEIVGSYEAIDVEAKSSNFSAAIGKSYIIDTSGGTVDITMPTGVNKNDSFRFKDTGNALANNITLKYVATNIEGAAADYIILTNFASGLVTFDGTSWWVL